MANRHRIVAAITFALAGFLAFQGLSASLATAAPLPDQASYVTEAAPNQDGYLAAVKAKATATPTRTKTPTATRTATRTATSTATATATRTPTATSTLPPTATATAPPPTATATATAPPPPTATATSTPIPTPTSTRTPTATWTATATVAVTATATATNGAIPTSADTLAFGTEVLAQMNAQRQANGCATPLVYNQKLWNAAQRFAYHLASNAYLSHTGKDGSTMVSRVEAEGYTWTALAENVAAGYGTPTSVVTGWMGSAGHRANILNCNLTEVGVGYYYIFPDPNPATNYRFYWVVDFGRP